MSVKISKDLDDLLCSVVIMVVRVMFVTSLVLIVFYNSMFLILLFGCILKLADFISYYVIKYLHYFINSEVDENDI